MPQLLLTSITMLQIRLVDALAGLTALAAIFFAVKRYYGSTIPGPRGLPLLGNLFDWPSEYQAETVQEWKKTFGRQTVVRGIKRI